MTNPWENLTRLTKYRVKDVHVHLAHWIVDGKGRVGLMIQGNESSFAEEHLITLKGIDVILDTTSAPNKLILLLNNREDIEIFLVLCNDLISVLASYEVDEDMIAKVALRLLRWKKLLQQETLNRFSLQKQMGLFGELIFIKEVLKESIGLEDSIRFWAGPKFEKQDFILESSAIEIKTYKTAGENIIEISSKEQLYTPKENLYLVVYALSEHYNGQSVKDLVDDILNEISDLTIQDTFINNVEDYGYIRELIKEPLVTFNIDQRSFYKVEREFPRIIPSEVSMGIKRIKYSIDLSTCNSYRIDKNNLKI